MMPDGMTRLASPFTVGDTIDRVAAAARASGMLVFARIDHAFAATEVGLVMRPAELLIFGSARVGTPVMQAAATAALDLPLKALAWQDETGITWLGFNDPEWIAQRHFLNGEQDAVETMTAGLFRIMHEATRPHEDAGPGQAETPLREPEDIAMPSPEAIRLATERKVMAQ